MDKKWRKAIFQLLPLDGRYFLAVALNQTKQNYNNNKKKKRREKKKKKKKKKKDLFRESNPAHPVRCDNSLHDNVKKIVMGYW